MIKMGKYNENIDDKSVWITATPTQNVLELPFCVKEAGHFYAKPDYEVSRREYDSYLFLYTIKGRGRVVSNDTRMELDSGCAAVIDCHNSHRYFAHGGEWEFVWIHMSGKSVKMFFDMLYPNGVCSITVSDAERLRENAEDILEKANGNGVMNALNISSELHRLFCILFDSSYKNEREKNNGLHSQYVESAVEMIHKRYCDPIAIDDITENVPMSKYHFIRVFKRIMGTTPYNYLTNCRINNAKIYLRSTNLTVGEISALCGFQDASNFIVQFKKHTSQKPLQYRHDFAGV